MPLRHYQPQHYQALLQQKLEQIVPQFAPYYAGEPYITQSPPSHFRMRAEFRMWHEGDDINYVMYTAPGEHDVISKFDIAAKPISDRMPQLRQAILASETLKQRLFQVEFLTTSNGDTLVSLIYHRKLDENWELAATQLQSEIGMQVIGRSRKQKITVGRDYVTETLDIAGQQYRYRQAEGVFTQPNAAVNCSMIEWVLEQLQPADHDLLELYCGIGNFTLPLAGRFRRVLATEISKLAVSCANHNIASNGIDNIALLRMSSEDFTQAIDGVRPFRRLRDTDLDSYNFGTVFVDPPRSGLDPATLALVSRMDRIVYISCNPETLLQNLASLHHTHRVQALAFFDQFPYTHHLECGVILCAN